MLNSYAEPAKQWLSVTPHDTNLLAQVDGRYPRSIFVGTFGDVNLQDEAGNAVVFKGVTGLLTVQPVIIKSTSTTASDIIALY